MKDCQSPAKRCSGNECHKLTGGLRGLHAWAKRLHDDRFAAEADITLQIIRNE